MRFITLCMAAVFCFALVVYGEDNKPARTTSGGNTANEKNKSAAEDGNYPENENVKAADLAKTYGVTADSIDRIKSTFSIGYGGIAKAFALAQKSGLTVDEILKMKTHEKLGWGEIAHKLKLEPGKDYQEQSATAKHDGEEKMEKQQARMESKVEKRNEKMEQKLEKENARGVK